MCHVLCVTCHMSYVTCHLSYFTYHLSPVTCHLSPVTCNFFFYIYIFFFFTFLYIYIFSFKQIGKTGGPSRWRVCYQWGLPRLVFYQVQSTNCILWHIWVLIIKKKFSFYIHNHCLFTFILRVIIFVFANISLNKHICVDI